MLGPSDRRDASGGVVRERTWVFFVPAEPKAVWDFLVRYENNVALTSPGSYAVLQQGTPGVAGAVYGVGIGWEGLPSTFRIRLADAEPGVSMRWYSRTGRSTGQALYELSPGDDGGTRMELHLSLTLADAFAPLEPFGWSLLTRCCETFVAGLKTHPFESEEVSTAGA